MQQSGDQYKDQNILIQIYEGMTVFDPEGETIGTVPHVYLGAVTPEEDARGQGAATAPDPGNRRARSSRTLSSRSRHRTSSPSPDVNDSCVTALSESTPMAS
jgi:hypothetical protein